MPRYQYQGTPQQPPPPTVTTGTGAITSAKAGTKSIWLQYRSRAGYSLVSTRVDISVGAGGAIVVTIPAAALPSPNGCCIWEYTILMSNTTSVNNACVVATVPGYDIDEITPITPPFTITLNRDEHLELSKAVATTDELPTGSDRLHGMRRLVDETNQIVEWDSLAGEWSTVNPSRFNTYVSSITGDYGMGQDISEISNDSAIIVPDYSFSGASPLVGFWLVNDSDQDILSGTRVGLAIECSGADVSTVGGIVGGIQLIFRGYVNTLTGVRDTSSSSPGNIMSLVDEPIAYQGKQTSFTLPKALAPGYAYWFDVQANLTPAMLNNRLPHGATLKFSPYFYADFAVWNPAGNLLGDFISTEYQSRRIVPSSGLTARALRGSGNITTEAGSFTFNGVAAQVVAGLVANTPNQSVWIDINGNCFASTTTPSSARKRAVVSTVNGAGIPTAWSSTIALDTGKLLRITPSFSPRIRDDYPDAIAGTTSVPNNATWLRIYVRPASGGNILMFRELIAYSPGVAEQEFIVGSMAGTNIGTVLPTPGNSFGLFEVNNANTQLAITGDSTFPANNYVIALALEYENTVTSISHDSLVNGCIYEFPATMAQVFARSQYYGEAVYDLTALRAIPVDQLHDLQIRPIKNPSTLYMWIPDSMGVDDGSLDSRYVKPNEISSSDPGRFVAYNRFLQVGTVSTGWEGQAEAEITSVAGVPTLNLTLPKGDRGVPGPANGLTIGSVSIGYGGIASASIQGSPPNQVLNLTIPEGQRGMPGQTGEKGETGDIGDRAAFQNMILYLG